MAKISTTVETKVEVKEIVLALTPREAIALKAVLHNVGGSVLSSLRKECQAVDEALEQLGVNVAWYNLNATGGVIFGDVNADVEDNIATIIANIVPAPSTLKDIKISSWISSSNRIPAIKELREKARDLGMSTGLKEAKDEIDRRVAEMGNPY